MHKLPFGLLLTVVTLLGACGEGDAGAVEAAPGPAAGPALQVTTHQVVPQRFEEQVLVSGELRADEQVELRSEVSGRAAAIRFREGQRVRRGELLVKINDDELQAQLRRARLERDLAAQREGRARALLAESTISQDLYDEAASRLATVDADIDLIEARIRQTEVRAPFDGVVGLRSVSEGGYLQPSTPIATLQRLDPIKIDFATAERYAGGIRPGKEIEFTVAGLDGTYRGEVYAVEPQIESASRTLRLRARAPNPDGELLPGAFAKVRLILDVEEGALMVPSIALVPGLRSTTVFVVENGEVAAREVTTGSRTEDSVVVTAGLEAGDRVITSGLQQLRPGAAVEVVEGGGSPATAASE